MTRLNFLLGIHCHQPVGNFEHVLRWAFEQAYRPFLDCLERHPTVRISLHYSGCLLEWLALNEPAFLTRIRGLAERGQVELISGGFYEPILSVIPREDAIGQLERLNRFLADEFGVTPRGFWLPERVWEPTVPSLAGEVGLEYTIVDDTHFLYAGLPAQEIHGYYVTEDGGAALAVFPIDKQLRYLIPFRVAEETIEYLRTRAEAEGVTAVTMADDGEKFGVWPGTSDWVYRDGWLESFFSALEENRDWLTMLTFSEVLDRESPRSLLYLPTAAYEEMMGWALPARAQERYESLIRELTSEGRYDELRTFIRGGFWRNFLSKYAESNSMHKKMLHVSGKVRALADLCEGGLPSGAAAERSGPREELGRALDEARTHLLRGQCNCAYWHGVFGGLYLNYLRSAVYGELIRSESIVDAAVHGEAPWIETTAYDFDVDREEELLVETGLVNLYLDPADGGTVFELDYRPARFNLCDTMTRRREAYHAGVLEQGGDPSGGEGGGSGAERQSIHERILVKERGLEERLVYDRWRRSSLRTLFFPASTAPEAYWRGAFEQIGDFADGSYDPEVKRLETGARVTLRHAADVVVDGQTPRLSVMKEVTVAHSCAELVADLFVEQKGGAPPMRFGVEYNLTLLAGDAPDRYFLFPGRQLEDRGLGSREELEEIERFSLVDEYQRFTVSFAVEPAASVWRFPVETVSLSESGIELTYQGTALLLSWIVALGGGGVWRARITQEISPWHS